MKKLSMFVFLLAIASQPAWLGAQDAVKRPRPSRVRNVPEPSTMLLVGAAAAGLAGVRKLLRSKRR
jgi:hypothetical protein